VCVCVCVCGVCVCVSVSVCANVCANTSALCASECGSIWHRTATNTKLTKQLRLLRMQAPAQVSDPGTRASNNTRDSVTHEAPTHVILLHMQAPTQLFLLLVQAPTHRHSSTRACIHMEHCTRRLCECALLQCFVLMHALVLLCWGLHMKQE